jgi:hypothetical protein
MAVQEIRGMQTEEAMKDHRIIPSLVMRDEHAAIMQRRNPSGQSCNERRQVRNRACRPHGNPGRIGTMRETGGIQSCTIASCQSFMGEARGHARGTGGIRQRNLLSMEQFIDIHVEPRR